MEIQARISHEKVDHSHENNVQLVVSVKAPALDWVTKRPALCVVPIVDLSGSMAGLKLEYAKASLLKLVDQLQPGDFAGLVTFSTRSQVVVEPKEVTAESKTELKNAIRRLIIGGGTNLCGGILDTLKLIADLDLPPKYLKRAIVFTDGQPTEGVTDLGAILRFTREARGSTSLSAFGYGDVSGGVWNGCDQDFMMELSQTGAGNYAYVQNPDDSLSAFAKELGGLLSTYAQDITLSIEPKNGHQISKVLTNVPSKQDVVGETEIEFPDILSEETRHFVFDVKLLEQKKAFPRPANVFDVRIRYSVLTESGSRETRTAETKAKVQFVKPGDEQKEISKDLNEIVALAQVARAQIEAEEKAKAGDYRGAADLMAWTSDHVRARGMAGLAVASNNIGARLANQQSYQQSTGYLRSLSAGMTRSYGVASMDASALADIQACNVELDNDAMRYVAEAFATPDANTNKSE